jgi:beta-glucosidase
LSPRSLGLLLAAALAAVLLVAPPARAAGRCGDHPWCNTALSPDERAGMLLGALTQDEKVSLLAGDDLLGVAGGEHAHTGTSKGVDRVGLPTVLFSDGPVGPRQGRTTALPIPMAVAASFDPGIARAHGDIVANEARNKGNDVVFAPTVNIMRTPLGGRTFEGYGEDPWLVSRTTVGWIQGAQGQGVIANVKHFAANNQEGQSPLANESRPGQPLGPPSAQGDRFTVNANVDERTLHEVYLTQFEAAVKEANVGSVMCSYNRLNGQYACENEHLLNEILKRDWGYRGFVLSDYGAAHNTFASLNNGLDFEPWPGFAYSPPAVDAALATNLSSPATVDDHVRRILRTLFAYGFFDRPAFRDDDAQIDKPAHARVAERIEESAITLLRNDGALPLRAARLKSVAVIGRQASTFVTGGGSGAVTPFAVTTPLAAIKRRVEPGVPVSYDDGSDPARAVAAAKAASVAIVFAGDYETEGADRGCLTLECPNAFGDQDALIEQVAAANPNTIVVLETGGPVLSPWRNSVRALVEAWYPGQEGGTAIARVLFGDVDPAGRLPVTFPRQEGDVPTAGDPEKYPGVAESETYKEGVFVGYRWWDQQGLQPAFPFGFGLSYTRFALRNLRIRSGGARGALATVTVDLTNTGRRAGTAVPELYLGLPSPGAGVPEPAKQLKGYAKVSLAPRQRRTVSFPLTARSLSYWDVNANAWRIAPGCTRVVVGRSARDDALTGTIAQAGARCAGAGSPSGRGRRVRHRRSRHRPHRAHRHAARFTG